MIIFTDGSDERFAELCYELDNYLYSKNGIEEQSGYDQYNTVEDIHDVALLIIKGEAAACGSFKPINGSTAEIKRVFTRESYRKQGCGKMVISALEARAKEKGYRRLILETGMNMSAAVGMYKSLGYSFIVNYGPYTDKPESVCMEKYI